MAVIMTVISILGALSGIYLGWSARGKENARDLQAQGGAQAKLQHEVAGALAQIQVLNQSLCDASKLQGDVDYIKRGVDEMRLEQRSLGRRFDELAERVARVEESSKQAHKRIDRIERTAPGVGASD